MSKEEFIHNVIPIRTELESYAFSLIRDRVEVDDILQEVYIKLWCMREKLHEYRSINALSFVITKNLCLNKIKSRRSLFSYDIVSEFRSDYQQPDEGLIEKEDLQNVLNIVAQLPSLQQSILKMRHIEELEIEEIAAITGCAEGAVRTNLSRARNRVRTLFMEGEGK